MADDVGVTNSPPSPSTTARWAWLAAVVPFGAGAFLGYQVAYLTTLGGLGGTMGAAFLGYGVAGLVLIAVLVGVVNAGRAAGRGRAASRYSFAVAALIAAGAFGGWAAVPVFDLGYHEPVVLQARGEATVALEGVPTFNSSKARRADCQSVPDGTEVGGVSALSLGDFEGNVLRAGFDVPAQGTAGGNISLFLDAAHFPEGSVPPMWDTDEIEVEATPDGVSGTLRFTDAAIRVDPVAGPPIGSWPATLSGAITWSCGSWFDPKATGAQTVPAQIHIELGGVDWVPDVGAVGTCEFEADGSVWVFAGQQVGLLRGRPMSVNLDLGGDPRAGDEVLLMLGVHEAAAPTSASPRSGNRLAATSGGPIVSWADLVALDEISGGGLRGRLTFEDLPREGTPNLDWPSTLSGDLSWECG